jgi:hypothetical protein
MNYYAGKSKPNKNNTRTTQNENEPNVKNRHCFQRQWGKRFRLNLLELLYGPAKLRDKKLEFKTTEQILIAFSGGMNSLALLHSLHEFCVEKTLTPYRVAPLNIVAVVHIDESLVLNLTKDEISKKNQFIIDSVSKLFNWTVQVFPLELIFMPLSSFLNQSTFSNEGAYLYV